ncbi:phytyl ester synthase 2, chloroplastic-like [Silene latifolia]|uniref:phytyl ester synthase 2, chloroplastic-like n=1 Tax=Silene latifolia TaxID=37657 RepID=UPI003D774749
MSIIGPPCFHQYTAVLSTTTQTPKRRLNRRSVITIAQKSNGMSKPDSAPVWTGGSAGKYNSGIEMSRGIDVEGDGGVSEKSVADYFDQAGVMVELTGRDGAGPRWFTPVECGAPRLNRVPLLLYLPGIDGVGLGLVRHHEKLGKIFEVWCLHIPAMDRTSFAELVKLVNGVVRSEHSRLPNRPIYLVGESVGACLALAVASHNLNMDIVLVLVNPATSFSRSSLQLPASLLSSSPVQSLFSITSPFNQVTGDSMRGFVDAVEKILGQSEASKDLLQGFSSLSSYYSVIASLFPGNTFLWKLEMLQNACAYANSRLHAIRAQTLILLSGRDPLLPSQDEGERLRKVLTKCEIRKLTDNGHFLLLEDDIDLVYILKGASYYRRGRNCDYVTDFLPPTPSEFKRVENEYWWFDPILSPVMLSTLEDGKIVEGLEGIPSEGPTLLVGYHMLLGFELVPLVLRILTEKNILVRGIAHPLMFFRQGHGKLPDLSSYDMFRAMGAVPVSGTNLFKLLASKSHILLYPGGMREALHRKDEEYQLFWPEESEFVRMAARFGAKIVPFGAVGEDDIGKVVFDYDDLARIPYFRTEMEQLTNESLKLRAESSGEVSNQQVHLPGILPQVPGRLYYLFGKPIDTKERRHELKDRQKAQEMYMEVKGEVERCLAYLKEKRETDPYRSLISRIVYRSTHGGLSSEIPTFEL